MTLEDNVSSIEEYRQKRKKKKRKKRLITVLVIIILLAVAALFVLFWMKKNSSPVTPGNQTGNTASVDTGIQANGFPISVGGANPVSIANCGKNIFLLTKNSVIAFNQAGKQVYTAHHGYSNPVMTASSKRVLTYDQGGYQFRVDSNKSVMGSKQLTEKIVYGAISEKGHTAIVTQTERYTIHLTVYDIGMQEVLSWNVTDQVITGVDFNSSSTACAVSAFSVAGGAVSSKIYELDLKKSEPQQLCTDLPDIMALSVRYQSNGNLMVVGDEKLHCLDNSGKLKVEWDYTGALLAFDDTSGEGAVIFYENTGGTGDTAIRWFDKNGQLASSAETEGEIVHAQSNGNRLLVLTEKQLLVFDSNLKQQKKEQVDITPMYVALVGNNGYVLSAGSLKQHVIS